MASQLLNYHPIGVLEIIMKSITKTGTEVMI
jgi:hypothetical protein